MMSRNAFVIFSRIFLLDTYCKQLCRLLDNNNGCVNLTSLKSYEGTLRPIFANTKNQRNKSKMKQKTKKYKIKQTSEI